MTGELEDVVIEAIKELTLSLGLEDYVTVGLSIVRGFSSGEIHILDPNQQAVGIMLGDSIASAPKIAAAALKQVGFLQATEEILRAEVRKLSDSQGIKLHEDVLEITKTGTPTFARQLKSFAQGLYSPSGQLPKLGKAKRRAVCERILALMGKGYTLVQAKKKVAPEFSASLSTVNRAWKDRANLLAK